MEKYTGAKTIGDGTYGSVLKAINKQNGKTHLDFLRPSRPLLKIVD